jgi:hypothetical protein
MEKENIDAKDKEFRSKLKDIRKNLAMRQVQADQKEDHPRIHVKVVIPVLMVLVVAVYFTGKAMQSHQLVSAVTADEPQTRASQSTGDTYPISPDQTESEWTSAETEITNGLNSSDNIIVDSEEKIPNSEIPIFIWENENDEKEEELTSPLPPSSSSSFFDVPSHYGRRIDQNFVCSGVEDRNCIVRQSDFVLRKGQNPHMWMEVFSDSVPYVLKHVYYHEGRRYVEVPLTIKYRRMRTWSYITLKDLDQVGSWHVEIVAEDGTVLGRADFKVTIGR